MIRLRSSRITFTHIVNDWSMFIMPTYMVCATQSKNQDIAIKITLKECNGSQYQQEVVQCNIHVVGRHDIKYFDLFLSIKLIIFC